MPTPLRHLILYLKLIWNHIVFWTIPTLQETYYTNLGHIYFELGKYRKAISKFDKSEKSHNNDKTFSKYNWFYLGRSYLNLGNYKNAIHYFNKYLALNPRDDFARYVIGTCYDALNEPELALQACQEALKNGADVIGLHIEVAKILKKMGRKDEALEHLRSAESKSADAYQKAIITSMILWVEDNLKEAIDTLKLAVPKIVRDPKNSKSIMKADIYLMLSRFQKEIKDTPGSLATLESAVSLYPKDAAIMNSLAFAYAEQEILLDKADRLITSALEYQPDNSYYLDTKGWILHKMRKSAEAEKVIQESLKLNPKSEETLKHLRLIQETVR